LKHEQNLLTMPSNAQVIMNTNDVDRNGMRSADDVATIVNDIDNRENSSLLKSKLMLSLFLVVAVVSVGDRYIARTQSMQFSSNETNEPSIRHLDEGAFAGWVECEGVATVPESFFRSTMEGSTDPSVYICQPTEDSYGCVEETPEPTSSPTTATPTRIPTGAPTVSPTVAATDPPTAKACFNQDGYEFGGDPDHHCFWVSKVDNRKQILCSKKTETREACPSVCGTCCGDSPWYSKFSVFGDVTCAVLAADSLLNDQFCPIPEVRTYCPGACGQCSDYVSMVPSSLLSTNETESPTDRLDDD